MSDDLFISSKTRWWHYLYPWSFRRVKSLIPAALSHFPGVRAHVLYTTPIKDHPMYRYSTATPTTTETTKNGGDDA